MTAAIARQTDAAQLTEILRAQIAATEQLGALSPKGKDMALQVLAAAEAESVLQDPAKH